MPSKFILALDQGTTSSRALLFDGSGAVVCMAQQPITQYFPELGWVEHDPAEIWATQLAVAREVIAKAGIAATQIAAIGITNQRETTVLWERATGKAVAPAIVWQDRRTATICDALKAKGFEPHVRSRTGLVVDAYFSGTKLRWLLDHTHDAQARATRGELAFGTVDTWLVWQLTKGRTHATDYTNASRTMLFDIHHLAWDDVMLDALDIPRAVLPTPLPSIADYGTTDPEWFGVPIPIRGIAGDQQAALFGQGCFSVGSAKNTYGTGCFMLMNTGSEAVISKHGLLTTLACPLPSHDATAQRAYALEGSVFVAGAAVQWLRDGVGLIETAQSSEAIATTVKDSGGVYVVPAFTGLGAPYWDMYARGAVVGLTRGTTAAHIVRATLEAIAYQTCDVLKAMEQDSTDAGIQLHQLRVDGGASANGLLMQFQADVLGIAVERPSITDTTALGAARLAAIGVGFWTVLDFEQQNANATIFSPTMPTAQREKLYKGWQKAVTRCLSWENE